MSTTDKEFLEQMQCALASFQAGALTLGHLATQLPILCDMLEFDDAEWYDAVADHLVTLESGSVFTPSSRAEEQQARLAISEAVDCIGLLLEAKVVQLS